MVKINHTKSVEKMQQNPIVRVGAILFKGDELLVVKSSYGSDQIIIVPGGGLECGETIFECAQREVLEETGLIVHAEKLVYVREFIHPKYNHTIDLFVLCSLIGGKLVTGHDPDQRIQIIKEALF